MGYYGMFKIRLWSRFSRSYHAKQPTGEQLRGAWLSGRTPEFIRTNFLKNDSDTSAFFLFLILRPCYKIFSVYFQKKCPCGDRPTTYYHWTILSGYMKLINFIQHIQYIKFITSVVYQIYEKTCKTWQYTCQVYSILFSW